MMPISAFQFIGRQSACFFCQCVEMIRVCDKCKNKSCGCLRICLEDLLPGIGGIEIEFVPVLPIAFQCLGNQCSDKLMLHHYRVIAPPTKWLNGDARSF